MLLSPHQSQAAQNQASWFADYWGRPPQRAVDHTLLSRREEEAEAATSDDAATAATPAATTAGHGDDGDKEDSAAVAAQRRRGLLVQRLVPKHPPALMNSAHAQVMRA